MDMPSARLAHVLNKWSDHLHPETNFLDSTPISSPIFWTSFLDIREH